MNERMKKKEESEASNFLALQSHIGLITIEQKQQQQKQRKT